MVDFADARLVTFTPNATNGQVVVANGAGSVITQGIFRVRWGTGAVGPLYVEKHTDIDNTARADAYEVTVDEKDHLIIADGCPVRVSGNVADVGLVTLERIDL